jgi:hypothetical protein
LLLGVTLMLLLPAILYWLILSDSNPDADQSVASFTPPWILISLGVFLVFGLVSGWLLWRVGVRPVQAPVAASASIFE